MRVFSFKHPRMKPIRPIFRRRILLDAADPQQQWHRMMFLCLMILISRQHECIWQVLISLWKEMVPTHFCSPQKRINSWCLMFYGRNVFGKRFFVSLFSFFRGFDHPSVEASRLFLLQWNFLFFECELNKGWRRNLMMNDSLLLQASHLLSNTLYWCANAYRSIRSSPRATFKWNQSKKDRALFHKQRRV